MKNGMVVLSLTLLAILYCISCGDDKKNNNIVEPELVVMDRPPIPEPTYYAGPVLDKSIELIVTTVVLSNFAPAVDSIWTPWCSSSGSDFSCIFYGTAPAGNRINLVKNDTIITNDDSLRTEAYYSSSTPYSMLCYPLSSQPYLQHVRYWVRLGNVERYSSSTSVTVTRSVTKGVERTEAEEFGLSIGMEATASGGFFVDFSVTLRTEFSYSSSTELTVSEEETTEESFTITSPDNKNIVYCVWQLVDEFRIIGADGQPFNDPNFKFSDSLFVAVVPSSEFVPMTTYFDN